MILTKADGAQWLIERPGEKLALRATLPGARVFDLATEALRKAKAAGVPAVDRLALALPASWCVNSPAPSTVLRRWALPPQREVWDALIEVYEDGGPGAPGSEEVDAILVGIRALGSEAFCVEAISKVLALLAPDAVPLMPPAARTFVLGGAAPDDGRAFVTMTEWFRTATKEGGEELAAWAQAHAEVPLSAAQALDRLLWFDSEGHKHFPPPVKP
jgi:hypothetical protein